MHPTPPPQSQMGLFSNNASVPPGCPPPSPKSPLQPDGGHEDELDPLLPPSSWFLRGAASSSRTAPEHPGEALVPFGLGKLIQQNGPEVVPHLPTLPNLCTDQSLAVWQGHPNPSCPAFGQAALPQGLSPPVQSTQHITEGSHLLGGIQSSGLSPPSGKVSGPAEKPEACSQAGKNQPVAERRQRLPSLWWDHCSVVGSHPS